MKKIILLICLIFLFFMADSYWQNLLKSYTDSEKIEAAILRLIAASGGASGAGTWAGLNRTSNDTETIEQAIARLIAVHEADPESHLGVGESLQSHKNADVIDHPALSIVADKNSNSKSSFFLNVFPASTDFLDNADIYNDPPFLELFQSVADSGDGSYFLSQLSPASFGFSNGDIIRDFSMRFSGAAGTRVGDIRFGWGKVEVKAGYYRIGYYTTSWQFTSWVASTDGVLLRFRFLYDSVNHILKVLLRDVEVLSVSYTYALESGDASMSVHVNRGSSAFVSLYFGNISFWYQGM